MDNTFKREKRINQREKKLSEMTEQRCLLSSKILFYFSFTVNTILEKLQYCIAKSVKNRKMYKEQIFFFFFIKGTCFVLFFPTISTICFHIKN